MTTINSTETVTQPTTNNYKTEMCKAWGKSGNCPYGSKCKFAHGVHELRLKCTPKHPLECFSYRVLHTCPYGERCQFLHVRRLPVFLMISRWN